MKEETPLQKFKRIRANYFGSMKTDLDLAFLYGEMNQLENSLQRLDNKIFKMRLSKMKERNVL